MVTFSEVLEWLERHDWILFGIHPPYRIFYKHGHSSTGLPILVEVRNHEVNDEHFRRIRRIVEGQKTIDENETNEDSNPDPDED